MRYIFRIALLATILMATALSVTASSLDSERRPRKKRKKKAQVEQVREQEQEAQNVAPVEEKPVEPKTEIAIARPLPPTDLMLGFTPAQTDSLVAVWSECRKMNAYDEFFRDYISIDTTEVDMTPDSVYVNRLYDLVSPIQLPYNSLVKSYINRYVNPKYSTISRVLGLSQYYFPMIEEELIKAELPVELRALPIIESALSSTAVSRAGAVGLWQFMPSTGKSYGLEVNSLVDERRDPLRATQAACKFLKDLYNIYNDWILAIAAYNCGPGNVNKAFARAGGNCRTFWDIYYFLPRETRGYVPAFIGASYAYAYHQQHNIEMTEAPIPLSVDTIHVNRLMHFGQIASTIDLPIETLRLLNPQYKLDIVPATKKSYTLVLPQRYVAQYIEHEEEIFSKDSTYLKEYINPANIDKKRLQQSATYYQVRRGDTLGGIARRYHVTVKQLMAWNRIRNPKSLRIGQRIRISR